MVLYSSFITATGAAAVLSFSVRPAILTAMLPFAKIVPDEMPALSVNSYFLDNPPLMSPMVTV